MRTVAIIPVKRFAAAKQRLAGALGAEQRAAIATAMVADVLAATSRCASIDRILVVTGEPAAARLARAYDAEVLADERDAGHREAARAGIRRAVELGAERVALLPGDCPLLDPAELEAALSRLAATHVGIVPDHHGSGTNALLLAPPDAIDPSFGPESRARHEALALQAGRRVAIKRVGSLALDLDTPADLTALRDALARRPDRAPATAGALASAEGRPRPAEARA